PGRPDIWPSRPHLTPRRRPSNPSGLRTMVSPICGAFSDVTVDGLHEAEEPVLYVDAGERVRGRLTRRRPPEPTRCPSAEHTEKLGHAERATLLDRKGGERRRGARQGRQEEQHVKV